MIFFLYGEDSFRSRQKLNSIKEKFLAKDLSRMNLVEIDGEKIQYNDLKKELTASPFLYDNKLIIIDNFLLKNKQVKIFDELNDLIKSTTIPKSSFIVFWESGLPDKRKKLFKTLKETAQVEVFELFDSGKVTNWIMDMTKSRGGEIDFKSANLLALMCGNDLWSVSSEIDKLLAYNKKITEENIKLLVSGKVNDSIFELIDAVSKKDKKKGLILIKNQLNVANNDATYLLNMFIRQFRILIMTASYLSDTTQSPNNMFSVFGIHPYVASKALTQVKNFKLSELKEIYCKLLEIDVKLKTGNSKNPEALLELFVMSL
jgi:DNA polymerase-3 subunit delta